MGLNAQIGIIGLAVMGKNLVLNLADQGIRVAVTNRTTEKIDQLMAEKKENQQIIPCKDLKDFCAAFDGQKIILLMVKAGPAIDQLIDQLLPLLKPQDIIIDGGNSFYKDTIKRYLRLKEKNIYYVGMGISGGEEGARHGASLTPGGHSKAWPIIEPLITPAAAKTEKSIPCIGWVGEEGSGHYVKMVHNAIEYALMQVISESAYFLQKTLKLSNSDISNIFKQYNDHQLHSYLIQITAEIFKTKDSEGPVIERILDVAGQKGTGRWAVADALERGISLPVIAQAVFMRNLSSSKKLREFVSNLYPLTKTCHLPTNHFVEMVEKALYLSYIICYGEGFYLLQETSKESNWKIDLAKVSRIWMGGCIIQGAILKPIAAAFQKSPYLAHLILDPSFAAIVKEYIPSLKKMVALAAESDLALPCMSACLSWLDAVRTARSPINLIQAQRDYFGAHGYERRDKDRGKFFHFDWHGDKKEKPTR